MKTIDIKLTERAWRDAQHFEFIAELGSVIKVAEPETRYVYASVGLELADELASFLIDYGADQCRAGNDGEGAIDAGDEIRAQVEAAGGPL